MGEGRKRVLGIMAAILAARKLAWYDAGCRVPAIVAAIADAVSVGGGDNARIDAGWPTVASQEPRVQSQKR